MFYHVSLNRNCLQHFVLMPMDVSDGVSNRKKFIIFMLLAEKPCVNYGVYHNTQRNLLHTINNLGMCH